MNQPEYIVEDLEKTPLTASKQDSLDRDYLALLADLEVLLRESKRVYNWHADIIDSLQVLVRSVREQS